MLLGMRTAIRAVLTIVGSLLLEDNSSIIMMENNTDQIIGEG